MSEKDKSAIQGDARSRTVFDIIGVLVLATFWVQEPQILCGVTEENESQYLHARHWEGLSVVYDPKREFTPQQ